MYDVLHGALLGYVRYLWKATTNDSEIKRIWRRLPCYKRPTTMISRSLNSKQIVSWNKFIRGTILLPVSGTNGAVLARMPVDLACPGFGAMVLEWFIWPVIMAGLTHGIRPSPAASVLTKDISWIPTVSKCLSLIYYITNYATKDDVSPWQIVAKAGNTAPASIFDDYKWRGPHLASLTYFEYCMLVRTKNIRLDFDPNHPKYGTHVQRLSRTESQVATVTFNGQLTEFQDAEDPVPGGHPKTEAIMDDVAEILLALFVSWENLCILFRQYATPANMDRC
jgi:hypothetical protein